MAAELSLDELYALEAMVDKTSLARVVSALGQVCDGKADHLRENWQDESAARLWSACAGKMERASDAVEKVLGK